MMARFTMMILGVLFMLASLCLATPQTRVRQQDTNGSTVAMLDAMQQLMTGEAEFFDLAYQQELFKCFEDVNPDLMEAHDNFWAGMVQFYDQNGVPGDEWGSQTTVYQEQNLTAQDYHGIEIYEPCNYASNLAYYRIVTQLCEHNRLGLWSFPPEVVQSIGEIFAQHTIGSGMWHGSHTILGGEADNRFIAVFSLLAHQSALANIPYSSILHDMSPTPRKQPATEIVSDLMKMFLEQPVEEWTQMIIDLDMPYYYITFGGIVMTDLTFTFEEEQVDKIVSLLLSIFDLPDDISDFLLNQYLPEIRTATKDIVVQVSPETQKVLKGNFVSSLIKLMYAFVWQEEVVTDNPIVFKPIVNRIGAKLIGKVNDLANSLNDFPVYDEDFKNGKNVYPGDLRCNRIQPHSKWHVESANGLMDLMLLSDDIYQITQTGKLDRSRRNRFHPAMDRKAMSKEDQVETLDRMADLFTVIGKANRAQLLRLMYDLVTDL